MTSINLELVFDGQAAKSEMIDARLLAGSLNGYSEVFRRTDEIVNGEASQASVLVRSHFRPGSFIAEVQLVQNVVENAKHLIISHQFIGAEGLAGLIGFAFKDTMKESLIDLYKWLKGEKPNKAVRIGDNVEVTLGQNKKMVTNIVYNLYGDSAIRAGMGKLTSPLREAEIDRISIKKEGTEQNAFERSEESYFDVEPLQLEPDSSPMQGERDTVLIVAKLSFAESSTWTFYERGATVTAKIEDEHFWEQVHKHNLTFGEGDRLSVKLAWKIEKKTRLIQKNTISKVHEVIPQQKQLNLDIGKPPFE
ncbi:MAG: hypothetical protein ACYCSP_00130 [Acidobacteriaceae bacterium]